MPDLPPPEHKDHDECQLGELSWTLVETPDGASFSVCQQYPWGKGARAGTFSTELFLSQIETQHAALVPSGILASAMLSATRDCSALTRQTHNPSQRLWPDCISKVSTFSVAMILNFGPQCSDVPVAV
jgi:hypothetical protein